MSATLNACEHTRRIERHSTARNLAGNQSISATSLANSLSTGQSVVLQANNDVTVNAAVNVNNPTGNGGALTLQAGRSVLLNSSITTDNGNLTLIANDPRAIAGNRDKGEAVITMELGATINAGSGNISLTAPDLVLKASLTGTGTLTLRPTTADSSIGIGDFNIRDKAPRAFHLDASEIKLLTNGFKSITIGHADGSGEVTVQGPVTFHDPVTIQSPKTGGQIIVNGTLTGLDNAAITLIGSGNTTILNGNIVTAGNAITITDRVILNSDARLDTTNSGTAGKVDLKSAVGAEREERGQVLT